MDSLPHWRSYPYYNVVICLLMAVVVHLVLRTKKVRVQVHSPNSWALGLAVGGMVAMFVIFSWKATTTYNRCINDIGGVNFSRVRFDFLPSRHGMLMDKRWSIVLRTSLSTLLLTHLYCIENPVVWISLFHHFYSLKNKRKIAWAVVPKPARRRLRRIG